MRHVRRHENCHSAGCWERMDDEKTCTVGDIVFCNWHWITDLCGRTSMDVNLGGCCYYYGLFDRVQLALDVWNSERAVGDFARAVGGSPMDT